MINVFPLSLRERILVSFSQHTMAKFIFFVHEIQRIPDLHEFLGIEKTVLRKIRISGTIGGPLLTQKSPTCAYTSQKLW